MVRRLRAGFVLRRIASAWLVLAAAALTAASSAAFAVAAGDFATAALPEGMHNLLARDNPSIAIQGTLSAAQADSDARAIRHSMRRAFGPSVPLSYDSARWSDQLALPHRDRGGLTPLIEVGALTGIRGRAVLVAGDWPGPAQPGQPIPAVAPATVVGLLRLSVGDVVLVRDTGADRAQRVRLTGVIQPRDPGSPYWRLNVVGPSGVTRVTGFVTYGPLIVDPADFASARLTVNEASWVAVPDLSRLPPRELETLAGRVSRAATYLSQSERLHGLEVATTVPALLTGIAGNLVVARSMLAILTAELLLLAGAALSLAARLLAGQRAAESALLGARGAGRWQLTLMNSAEAALLCAAAVGAGIALGGPLAALLARSGALHAADLPIPGAPAPASWWAAAAVFAVCAGVLLWPGLHPEGGVMPRRQAALAGVMAAGGDIALVSLALLAGWQLRRYSAVAAASGGGLMLDPVLVAAPALALAGGAVALLRLLPLLARAAHRVAARGAGLGLALPGWQISRRPIRQSGPALLVTLAVATATFAIIQHQSAARSGEDQAAFWAGADIRLDSAVPVPLAEAATIASAPGVASAMPVARIQASNGEILALDTRRAAATVLLRHDLAREPTAELWRSITPPAAAPGPAVPARARRLAITASLGPRSAGMSPAPVVLTVQDGSGDTYQRPAGILPADGRPHVLVARLPGRVIAPLRLVGIVVRYTVPAPPSGMAAFTVSAFAASPRTSGPLPPPFAPGGATAHWAASATAFPPPGVWKSRPAAGRGWRATGSGGASAAFFPGFFQFQHGPPPQVSGVLNLAVLAPRQIPAVATRSFLSATGRRVGAVVPESVGTASFQAKVVAAVADFPTTPRRGGALLMDQAALQDVLVAAGDSPEPVTQWWLATRPGTRPPPLPATTVTDRAEISATLLSNPLSAGPQQALVALALAAAALAVLGLGVAVIAAIRERRAVSALLAALGVTRPAQARMLCLEQFALSGPAALAGVGLGAVLALLLVPAVTLTVTATAPVPPVLMVFAWRQIAAVAVAVSLAPVALAALTVTRRPDPAAQLRMMEAV